MTAPGPDALEKMARAIAPRTWEVFDGYLKDTLRIKNAAYDPDAFKDKASMALALAAWNAGPGPKLAAALKPFADSCPDDDHLPDNEHLALRSLNTGTVYNHVPISDFRRAWAALTTLTGEGV